MINKKLQHINRTIRETAERCKRSPAEIRLVAVSKRFPVESICEARAAGQTLFGENYLQEAAEKRAVVGNSIRLHFIGHLQSNKAKIAAEIFDMIETIDRVKIASALNRHLLSNNRQLDILVQVNIGRDPNKSGVLPEKTEELLEQLHKLKQLQVKGLMTIPPLSNTPEQARSHFRNLRILGETLRAKGLFASHGKIELSMGMSDDYQIAIEEGATLIRVGTAIFGTRPIKQ